MLEIFANMSNGTPKTTLERMSGCINNFLIYRALTNCIQVAETPMDEEIDSIIMLFGKAEAPVKCSSMELIYTECKSHLYSISSISCNWFTDPETILQFPWLRGFPLSNRVRRRIPAYFHTNFPRWTFHAWLAYIPEHAER